MASIFKRPSGTWTVELYVEKDRKTKIGLPTKSQREARRIADKIQALYDSKRTGLENADSQMWLVTIQKDSPKLFKRLCELGLAKEQEQKKFHTFKDLQKALYASRSIKDSTKSGYVNAIVTLNEFFGAHKYIEEIGPYDVAQFYEWLHSPYANVKNGKGLAKATIERRVRHFRSLFVVGIKMGWIEKNPFTILRSGDTPNRERHFYVSQEIALQVIQNAKSKKWRTIFALGRFAGVRGASELYTMKWSDIQYSKENQCGVIVLNVPKKEGKTDERRPVPLCPILENVLKDYEPVEHNPDDFLFPRMVYDANLSKCTGDLIRQGGLDVWPEPWYNLRRSFCSDLMESGIDPKLYELVAGHTFYVGMKHYQILHPDRQREGFDKIITAFELKNKSGDKSGDKTQ